MVVEDDPDISASLGRVLTHEGFDVLIASTGYEALEMSTAHTVDLVLLDLTLPGLDGLEVCRRLRRAHDSLPIVMLTARAAEADLVVGFAAGADDYVAKPFSLVELVARIRARLRLVEPSTVHEAQDVRVDRVSHTATHGVECLQLTPMEFDLLAVLVGEAGRLVARSVIMRRVWGDGYSGSTRTLDMHVSSLRKKLGDDPDRPRYITTVRGVGFRFEVA